MCCCLDDCADVSVLMRCCVDVRVLVEFTSFIFIVFHDFFHRFLSLIFIDFQFLSFI